MLRVGFATSDHLHFWSYLNSLRAHPQVEVVGIFDRPGRTVDGLKRYESLDLLLNDVDALAIMSQNVDHAEFIEAAAKKNKHILCEKPVVVSKADRERVIAALQGKSLKFVTCFPCRFAPAFQRLLERVRAGDIGNVKAVCATNHGSWPERFAEWFVDPALSGGGAMVDHVVHVADLLWLLLGEEPASVEAQISHNLKNRPGCEDCALVTLTYESGVFVTLDSSWSRHENYKTWGDVTLNVVGETGVIELDMFGQAVSQFPIGGTMGFSGYASDNDALLVNDFVRCILEDRPSPVSLEDGLRASDVFLRAYESLAAQPI